MKCRSAVNAPQKSERFRKRKIVEPLVKNIGGSAKIERIDLQIVEESEFHAGQNSRGDVTSMSAEDSAFASISGQKETAPVSRGGDFSRGYHAWRSRLSRNGLRRDTQARTTTVHGHHLLHPDRSSRCPFGPLAKAEVLSVNSPYHGQVGPSIHPASKRVAYPARVCTGSPTPCPRLRPGIGTEPVSPNQRLS